VYNLLWHTVRSRTAHALAVGALLPIPTETHRLEDRGIPFSVRIALGQEQKSRATRVQKKAGVNPFLPPDRDLFVADLSETHFCLLNKYNVVENHLLILTRAFEPQEDRLNLRDFAALWRAMAEIDGLGFYNSGPEAGASQPHKHLQLVPSPLGEGPERVPLERVFGRAGLAGGIGRLPAFPFPHAVARLDLGAEHRREAEAPRRALTLYRELCRAVFPGGDVGPYNLLLTRDWMLLVPRVRDRAELGDGRSLGLNALAFAGSLFVPGPEELARLRRHGPVALLATVVGVG